MENTPPIGTLLHSLAVASVATLIVGAVGMVFMTWLQGRFARVNAAVLFIALPLLGWLWGIAGLLLGGPLLAIAKVIRDRVESLKRAGELPGRWPWACTSLPYPCNNTAPLNPAIRDARHSSGHKRQNLCCSPSS